MWEGAWPGPWGSASKLALQRRKTRSAFAGQLHHPQARDGAYKRMRCPPCAPIT